MSFYYNDHYVICICVSYLSVLNISSVEACLWGHTDNRNFCGQSSLISLKTITCNYYHYHLIKIDNVTAFLAKDNKSKFTGKWEFNITNSSTLISASCRVMHLCVASHFAHLYLSTIGFSSCYEMGCNNSTMNTRRWVLKIRPPIAFCRKLKTNRNLKR